MLFANFFLALQVSDSDPAGCGGCAAVLPRQDWLWCHQPKLLSVQPHPLRRVTGRLSGQLHGRVSIP